MVPERDATDYGAPRTACSRPSTPTWPVALRSRVEGRRLDVLVDNAALMQLANRGHKTNSQT
jgi:hypothetical protein